MEWYCEGAEKKLHAAHWLSCRPLHRTLLYSNPALQLEQFAQTVSLKAVHLCMRYCPLPKVSSAMHEEQFLHTLSCLLTPNKKKVSIEQHMRKKSGKTKESRQKKQKERTWNLVHGETSNSTSGLQVLHGLQMDWEPILDELLPWHRERSMYWLLLMPEQLAIWHEEHEAASEASYPVHLLDKYCPSEHVLLHCLQ